MDFRYHVDLHTLDNSLTPSKVFSTSLQTDPDLYALKNKKKNNGYRSNQLELKHLLKDTPIPHLVSTNRIAYVEALVGNLSFLCVYIHN